MISLDDKALRRRAEKLAEMPARTMTPVSGSGNNRLYRLDCAEAVFALKTYPAGGDDPRDRLAVESDALRFLGQCGAGRVPGLIAVDRDTGLALHEWVAGAPVGAAGAADVDAALEFVAWLKTLKTRPGSQALGPASEACLSGAEVVRQVRERAAALSAVVADEPDLFRYLADDFTPTLEVFAERAAAGCPGAGIDFAQDLPATLQTLSPSDFGFHNALRAADGALIFLDFEYFGWDDPVKLTADFLLHPGMALAPTLKRRFADGARHIFGDDDHFSKRLEVYYPLYGLRWCMILLNEFLPDRWRRRVYAGTERDGAEAQAKQRQLAKARALIEALKDDRGHFPHDA